MTSHHENICPCANPPQKQPGLMCTFPRDPHFFLGALGAWHPIAKVCLAGSPSSRSLVLFSAAEAGAQVGSPYLWLKRSHLRTSDAQPKHLNVLDLFQKSPLSACVSMLWGALPWGWLESLAAPYRNSERFLKTRTWEFVFDLWMPFSCATSNVIPCPPIYLRVSVSPSVKWGQQCPSPRPALRLQSASILSSPEPCAWHVLLYKCYLINKSTESSQKLLGGRCSSLPLPGEEGKPPRSHSCSRWQPWVSTNSVSSRSTRPVEYCR